MDIDKALKIAQTVCLIAVTFVACFYFFDKFVVWKYHVQAAGAPCELCMKVNPELQGCFKACLRSPMTFGINATKSIGYLDINASLLP